MTDVVKGKVKVHAAAAAYAPDATPEGGSVPARQPRDVIFGPRQEGLYSKSFIVESGCMCALTAFSLLVGEQGAIEVCTPAGDFQPFFPAPDVPLSLTPVFNSILVAVPGTYRVHMSGGRGRVTVTRTRMPLSIDWGQYLIAIKRML